MDRDDYRRDNNNTRKGQSRSRDLENEWDQLSDKIGKNSDIGNEDDFFEEVNSSLAKQISMEMEEKTTSQKRVLPKKKKFPLGLKIFAAIVSVIMLTACFLAFTSPGRKLLIHMAGNYIYQNLDYQSTDVMQQSGDEDAENQNEVKKPQDDIVNILLLGVEEIGGASNTDVMIIATMNTKNKTVKLTSLMRDIYVEIDGYNNNKLNSVYSKGGISLLYDTIEDNFGIRPDGYAMVNFDKFEQVVDIIGGVEITLTSKEASYLNRTNYISNPAYRNLVEGTQTVNGNQAVGYCRIRKVATATEHDDFGRTQRQRAVLNSIFEKLKSKNIIQLGLIMNDILKKAKIETDITQNEFNRYLEEAASLNVKQLENLRIPEDGTFENKRVPIGSYNVEVLCPTDWNATRETIHQFIYGTSDDSIDESSDSSDFTDNTDE